MREIFAAILGAIFWFALLLLGLFFILKVLTAVSREVKKSTIESEKLIGEKVVFKEDTVKIVAFDFLEDRYTLENGYELKSELVNNLEIIK